MKNLYIKTLSSFVGFLFLASFNEFKAAATNYNWDVSSTDPSLTISNTTGCALATYTFSQTTANNNNSKISLLATITVTFPLGVNLTTCTTAGSSFNGLGITVWSIIGQTISFSAPAAVGKNASFNIVIANVTNGGSISAGATVTCVNQSGGVNQTDNAAGTPIVDYQVTTTACPVALANDNCSGTNGTPVSLTPAAAGSGVCTTTNGTTYGGTLSSQAVCTGDADDDVWYKFVANNANHQVTVDGVVGFNAVVQVISGTCASPTSVQCINASGDGGVETASLTGLTVGSTYFIRIYHSGAVQVY